MSMNTNTLRVVVFEDRGWWVAQCLEYDLCTSSKNLKDLPRQIASQLRLQVALDRKSGRQPFAALPQAPEKYWDLYEQATPHSVVELKGSVAGRLLKFLRSGVPSFQAQLSLASV
jgi:hypothetical protein